MDGHKPTPAEQEILDAGLGKATDGSDDPLTGPSASKAGFDDTSEVGSTVAMTGSTGSQAGTSR